ncbi:amino-acid N-acetyltransferase [Capronia coronata CBS 617.96]|uniref:Amino-acid acetyltransferase, mitochondrial n=1 Tax=Capronia coronata CBS 617.96 TaxID=1182541 RepID=W9YDA5_9EURO|nr:amino-acid N-acetyltransferase [Capronia coronata CBS 617.96]EXJ90498.1 amino-acid N-acetyltransferase [Capronia coronata CBS 617.96]
MTQTALTRSTVSLKGYGSLIPNTNIAADVLRAHLLSVSRPAVCSQRLSRPRPYSAQTVVLRPDRPDPAPPVDVETLSQNERHNSLPSRARQRLANKEFFTSLLSSAATKRDAKAFITRLKNPIKTSTSTKPPASVVPTEDQSDVNLGDLFGRSRAMEDSPVFTQFEKESEQSIEEQETLHVALVKISNVSAMSEDILRGIAKTLSSLTRLSMVPCVVLEEPEQLDGTTRRQRLRQTADRLVGAIDYVSEFGGRRLDNVLSFGADGRARVFLRKLLTRPLRRSRIPVVVPIAYSEESQHAVSIAADEAVLALTRELVGLDIKPRMDVPSEHAVEEVKSMRKQISVDRIIVIDETGAIPSTKSIDRKHVFVNLEQEYSAMQEELRSSTDGSVSPKHASNLKLFRDALKLLPHSASGLLTTPLEAANSSRTSDEDVSNVGTRRQKNPLIHNLLTDKPAYSSSLPTRRLGQDRPLSSATNSTFIKRGMPLVMLPHPDVQPWKAAGKPRLKLTDPEIDLDRLTYLIEDSFNRKLDVPAYLKRVNDRIAGVIIAGDYEGGAILTWETPQGASDSDTSRLVPYLDKFAVLKKSQGAGGVADIVFNAMVRTCFPNGVCWRSRKDNPVNKWYFERSRGTWKIPGTNWTMFWTTPGLSDPDKSQTFLDYESVCRNIQPTWADGKKIAD